MKSLSNNNNKKLTITKKKKEKSFSPRNKQPKGNREAQETSPSVQYNIA